MTFRGTIDNGKLILDDGSRLPDGTRVDVRIARVRRRRKGAATVPDPLTRIARRAIATGIPDLADEHDHYAYGTPKRFSKPTRAAKRRGVHPKAERSRRRSPR